MQADGYSLDDKRSPVKDNDIPEILSRYHSMENEESRARTEKSFLVPFDEIKENDWDLSINRYKEIVYEEIEYDPPATIISDIEALDKQREEALNVLKEMLNG
jgi:type I restriction enzyme M protein